MPQVVSLSVHEQLLEWFNEEMETRDIGQSRLFFEVFGARYAEQSEERRRWFEFQQREYDRLDERRRDRELLREQRNTEDEA